MDTNKMREQFEAAFARETSSKASREKANVFEVHGGFESVLLAALVEDRNGDTYTTSTFAGAWWAWQASREAVVVELPVMLLEDEDEVGEDWPVNEAYNNGIKGCKVAILAQGLKVTP